MKDITINAYPAVIALFLPECSQLNKDSNEDTGGSPDLLKESSESSLISIAAPFGCNHHQVNITAIQSTSSYNYSLKDLYSLDDFPDLDDKMIISISASLITPLVVVPFTIVRKEKLPPAQTSEMLLDVVQNQPFKDYYAVAPKIHTDAPSTVSLRSSIKGRDPVDAGSKESSQQNDAESSVSELLQTFQNDMGEKRFVTDTMISSVLSMKCFSVNDLRLIAEKMQLSSYQHDVTSFKKSYRSLGKAIFNDCHVSFGMVEGLHRMYTVKNVLEGRLLRAAEEPVPTNLFLKKKVMVHLHILDTLSKEDLSGFSKLSLLYMKVKNASVERTLYDELINIINDVQQTKESIVDLTKNAEMFCQLGRYDKEEHHILFKQRLFIYTYIARFAFNDKKSTVLYKFQHQHVEQAVGRQHIKDKHQYLNLPLETNLSDKNLFQYVSEVSLSNLIIKAQEFTTISTKATSRNNDWTMKPICQQLRVILSYYVLASVSLESMEESTRIFSPNYKFTHEQVQRNVDILSTMFKIVDTIDDVVTIYRKKTGISATLIYATKIEQMLQMNLFQDVLDVIKKVGHNPKMPVDIIIDLNSENEDILTKYKDDLFTVCKGPADKKLTNTNVKHGMFGTETFSAYTVDKKVLFSYFFEQVNNSTLSVYNVTAPTNPTSSLTTTWNDIAASYVVDEAADDGWDDEEEVDHGTEHRSDHNKPKSTSKAAVDETGSVPIAPIFTSPYTPGQSGKKMPEFLLIVTWT